MREKIQLKGVVLWNLKNKSEAETRTTTFISNEAIQNFKKYVRTSENF